MVGRVPRPAELRDIDDPEQALQQFVNQSPWDEQQVLQRYRTVMAEPFASPQGIFVIDDTGFPKQGKHSVGVQHQYCGQLGKKANCQVAVTVHYVSPEGHFPAALRLFLPESWTGSPERLERGRCPRGIPPRADQGPDRPGVARPGPRRGTPARRRGHHRCRLRGLAGRFARDWQQRRLFYIAGVTSEMVVFTEEPRWDWPAEPDPGPAPDATPPGRGQPATGEPEIPGRAPAAAQGDLARGDQGEAVGEVRLGPGLAGPGLGRGDCAGAEPIWLLIEERADGKIQYAFSNLPAGTSRIKAVRLWKSRWPVEQGYQQMKEELGLNHFEGRSWRGFHHHACLVMLAYGFLALEQLREKEAPARRGKKGTRAADHPAGDPPRLAAIAEADGEAGLHLLQPTCSCF